MTKISLAEIRRRCRKALVRESIPQRISVILFCTFGSIMINGLWSSTDRLLVAKRDFLQKRDLVYSKRNTTHNGTSSTAPREEMLMSQISFYIAYVLTLIPAGILNDKVGGKGPYLTGMLMASIVSFFLPLITAYFSWHLLCFFMMCLGITQAITRTAETVLVARWSPACERGVLGGFIFPGKAFGIGIGHMISWMAIQYDHSWFIINLFWGTITLLWSFLFSIIVYDDFSQDSYVSRKEKALLEKEVPQRFLNTMPPLKRILTSRCVWALIIGQISHEATAFIVVLPLLSYAWWFHKVEATYDFYKSTATELDCFLVLFAIVGLWMMSVSTGIIIDHATQLRWNKKKTRLIPMCIGFALPNVFLLATTFTSYDFYLTRIFYVATIITKGPHYCSFCINYMDITANFCGFTISLIFIGGEMVHFLTIVVIAFSERVDWHYLFWTLFAISMLFLLVCATLFQVHRSEWDFSESEREEESRRPREVTFNIDGNG